MENSPRRLTRRITGTIMTAVLGAMVLATPAFAATPPSETEFASDILESFAGKLISVVTALATNAWVLALFGFGIAVVVVKRVLSKGASKVGRVVG